MKQSDILSTLLRRRSLVAMRRVAIADGVDIPVVLVEQLERIERAPVRQLQQTFVELGADSELVRFGVARYLINGIEGRRSGYGFDKVVQAIAAEFGDSELHRLAEVLRARECLASHQFVPTIEILAPLQAPQDLGGDVFATFVWCTSRRWLGWAQQHRGDLQGASRELTTALEIAEQHDFCVRQSYRVTAAALSVATGQFRDAIQALSDEDFRRETRDQDDIETLLYSHLLATEAALSLKATAKANFELCEMETLIDAHRVRLGHYRGYLVLLSAKLDTLWGNHDEGVHLFNHAIELFEALNPPDYAAVIDAKLELVKFAIRDGQYDIALTRIGELLDESEERGCIDARTRLLGLQAKLFMDENAPTENLREAYADLVSRVHLMNNPRLTFMAYADLYAYARKNLQPRDQKFWLTRLKGLRDLLDRSCYEDLYGNYVLERYRQEIEGGLEALDWDLDRLTE